VKHFQIPGLVTLALAAVIQTGGKSGTAEGDASAVLSTLAEAVTGGQLGQLICQLPSGYAPLFGQPGLA
jgi:hypothetical protein